MIRGSRVGLAVSAVLLLSGFARAETEGVAALVASVDPKAQCLSIEWHNDKERKVCWNEKTKFSVLETGKAAKPGDVRKGSYLRMEGEDKDGTYQATEIVIWEGQSQPAK